MRFSDAQVQFIRSLRDRMRDERGEGPAISSSITRMQQERFYEVIDIAAHDAEEAAKLARKLTMWGIRLMPYSASASVWRSIRRSLFTIVNIPRSLAAAALASAALFVVLFGARPASAQTAAPVVIDGCSEWYGAPPRWGPRDNVRVHFHVRGEIPARTVRFLISDAIRSDAHVEDAGRFAPEASVAHTFVLAQRAPAHEPHTAARCSVEFVQLVDRSTWSQQ